MDIPRPIMGGLEGRHMISETNEETESAPAAPVAAMPSAHTPIELIELAGHSPEVLGSLSRAYSMLSHAQRLYEQEPTEHHENLLKTARRLLKSLQSGASRS